MWYLFLIIILLLLIFYKIVVNDEGMREHAADFQYDVGSLEQDNIGSNFGTKEQKIRYPKITDLYKYGDTSVPYWEQDGYVPKFPKFKPTPPQKNNKPAYC